jgi:hypothetical protein
MPDRRHLLGHRCAFRRPVLLLERQAPLAEGHQVGLRPAAVEPGKGIGRLPAHGLQAHGVLVPAKVRRRRGADLAQHGSQAEHIGACIQLADLPGGLLGRHVRRRAQHRAGARV